MSNIVSKSVDYFDVIDGKEQLIKAAVMTAPRELEISNLRSDDNHDFIFLASVNTEIPLPPSIIDNSRTIIFYIGKGEENSIGYLENNLFREIPESRFIQKLMVNLFEILVLSGDSGHFTSRN